MGVALGQSTAPRWAQQACSLALGFSPAAFGLGCVAAGRGGSAQLQRGGGRGTQSDVSRNNLVGFKKEQKHSVLLSSFSKNKTKTSKGRGWLQFETRAFLHKTQRSFTYLSNCNKEHEDQWCQKASNNK